MRWPGPCGPLLTARAYDDVPVKFLARNQLGLGSAGKLLCDARTHAVLSWWPRNPAQGLSCYCTSMTSCVLRSSPARLGTPLATACCPAIAVRACTQGRVHTLRQIQPCVPCMRASSGMQPAGCAGCCALACAAQAGGARAGGANDTEMKKPWACHLVARVVWAATHAMP